MLILWMRWDVCGLRQRGISAWCILEWNERDSGQRQQRRTEKTRGKKCVFYCNIDRHSTIANERANPKTEHTTLRTLSNADHPKRTKIPKFIAQRRSRRRRGQRGDGEVNVNGRGTCERTYFAAAVEPAFMPWHFISILIRAQFGISFHLLEVFFGKYCLALIHRRRLPPSRRLCVRYVFLSFSFLILKFLL